TALCNAHGFSGNNAEHDAPVVVDRADTRLAVHISASLGVDIFLNALDHGVSRSGDVNACSYKALRGGPGRDDILFASGPPYADHSAARIARAGGCLQRS